MKKTMLAATAFATLMGSAAMSETVGVTMALFDDNFLTVLRNGIQEFADGLDGVDVQIEDVARQVELHGLLRDAELLGPGSGIAPVVDEVEACHRARLGVPARERNQIPRGTRSKSISPRA